MDMTATRTDEQPRRKLKRPMRVTRYHPISTNTKDIAAIYTKLEDISRQLAKMATQDDIKKLQKQIDDHTNAISAGQNNHERLAERVNESEHKLELFKNFIKDQVAEIGRNVSNATDMITRTNDQHHRRIDLIDKRLSDTENDTRDLAKNLTTVELQDADTRQRVEKATIAFQNALFGNPDEKRPGVITTLENTNNRIDATNTKIDEMGKGFLDALNGVVAAINPLVKSHEETAEKKARWQARKRFIASVLLSRQGLAFISAAVVVTAPIVIRWIQTNINLNPTIAGILNQIVIALNFYAGK